ncbi:MAG TPA: hypothetical protein PLP88_14555 [Bacteroidales bacterium]|nr:hypothetical protein [Bacteroidales bacterium]
MARIQLKQSCAGTWLGKSFNFSVGDKPEVDAGLASDLCRHGIAILISDTKIPKDMPIASNVIPVITPVAKAVIENPVKTRGRRKK